LTLIWRLVGFGLARRCFFCFFQAQGKLAKGEISTVWPELREGRLANLTE